MGGVYWVKWGDLEVVWCGGNDESFITTKIVGSRKLTVGRRGVCVMGRLKVMRRDISGPISCDVILFVIIVCKGFPVNIQSYHVNVCRE